MTIQPWNAFNLENRQFRGDKMVLCKYVKQDTTSRKKQRRQGVHGLAFESRVTITRFQLIFLVLGFSDILWCICDVEQSGERLDSNVGLDKMWIFHLCWKPDMCDHVLPIPSST